jgi:hypothetical protein
MADDYTILNPGAGGDVMDESLVVYPTAPTNRKRPRVVITGEGIDDIADAKASNVMGGEMGLVTRPVLPNYPGAETNTFDDVSLVPANTETTVVTYTVPVSQTFYFLGVHTSGNANALFKVYVDGSVVLAGRTSVANLNWSQAYSFSPIKVIEGVTISVKVIHRASADCDFEGTILGYTL